MSNPPTSLDGAQVLWWAWAGETAFGELIGAEGEDRWVYGLAVCRYDDGQLYRFSCNKNWEVVMDVDHLSEDEAKSELPTNYDSSRIIWQRATQHGSSTVIDPWRRGRVRTGVPPHWIAYIGTEGAKLVSGAGGP